MRIALACVLILSTSLARARADEAMPEPDATPARPAVDPPELSQEYERAVSDFAAGKYAEAAAAFDDVAARSVDPGRRAAAAELAKRAHAVAPAITPKPAEGSTVESRSHDGRYMFLIGTSALGLGVYGPALPIIANTSDPKTGVGLYMLSAGASFFLPYLATRNTTVTWGMTDAWWWGATRGVYHGSFAAVVISPKGYDSPRPVFATISLSSIGEGLAFTLWAHETRAPAALTNLMGKGGDFGMMFGAGLMATVTPNDGENSARLVAAAGLGGAAVGVISGYELAPHRDFTWGDSEVLRAAGYLGGYAALVPLVLAETTNYRVYFPTVIAGMTGGLLIGDRLLEGRDFSPGQGIVTELSTLAGGAVGAGLGYLISPNNDHKAEAKIILTGGVLGAIGGFALAYLGLDTKGTHGGGAAPASVQIVPQIGKDQQGLSIAGTF